jgi:hypothetical protein
MTLSMVVVCLAQPSFEVASLGLIAPLLGAEQPQDVLMVGCGGSTMRGMRGDPAPVHVSDNVSRSTTRTDENNIL